MSEDTYTVNPTSRDSAICDPIVLRLTERIRLIFVPQLVNSVRDRDAAIKGVFAYQRKRRNEEWDDPEHINLACLRSGEGVKLNLNTDEVLKLFSDLAGLYQLHAASGIPPGKTIYLKTDAIDSGSLEVTVEEVQKLFDKIQNTGVNVVDQALNWITQLNNAEQALQQLQLLDSNNLQKLNYLAAASSLRKVLTIWQEGQQNSDEEFWQQTLSEYSFTLSQVFSSPVVILAQKAYVGGKGIENQGGNLADYIVRNDLTKNTALVEIKTPTTSLLGNAYRTGIYTPSKELSGAIAQTLTYKDSFIKESSQLKESTEDDFAVIDPSCLLIIGNSVELDSHDKRKSFELFRASIRSIDIITCDELFAKIDALASLIEGGS